MAEKVSEEKRPIPPTATGPAGPIPHPPYCRPQCYADGKHQSNRACQCKACGGDAHGRGRKYAFDHGYLRDSPPIFRKTPKDQEWLFPKEPPNLVEESP